MSIRAQSENERGGEQDASPVTWSVAPKSVTVEDSFKSCTTLAAARHVLRVLAPDLLARVAEDAQVRPKPYTPGQP